MVTNEVYFFIVVEHLCIFNVNCEFISPELLSFAPHSRPQNTAISLENNHSKESAHQLQLPVSASVSLREVSNIAHALQRINTLLGQLCTEGHYGVGWQTPTFLTPLFIFLRPLCSTPFPQVSLQECCCRLTLVTAIIMLPLLGV